MRSRCTECKQNVHLTCRRYDVYGSCCRSSRCVLFCLRQAANTSAVLIRNNGQRKRIAAMKSTIIRASFISRWLKVIEIDTYRLAIDDCLLYIISNHGPISYRFEINTQRFLSKICQFSHPANWNFIIAGGSEKKIKLCLAIYQ